MGIFRTLWWTSLSVTAMLKGVDYAEYNDIAIHDYVYYILQDGLSNGLQSASTPNTSEYT